MASIFLDATLNTKEGTVSASTALANSTFVGISSYLCMFAHLSVIAIMPYFTQEFIFLPIGALHAGKETSPFLKDAHISCRNMSACSGFTPLLADFYRAVQTEHPGTIEIVFVSRSVRVLLLDSRCWFIICVSDRDQCSFDGYFAEMPWYHEPLEPSLRVSLDMSLNRLSLPFENSDLKETLSQKFSVRGIPFFVVLDKNGATLFYLM